MDFSGDQWPSAELLYHPQLTLLSFCGYHESVPLPMRALTCQARCHPQQPAHLPLLRNHFVLLHSDSCQYFFFSIKIPNLQPHWADLQNKGFFNNIDFLLCFTVPQEKITDKTSLFHPLIFEVKVCGVWFSFNHWIRLCDGYNTVLFFLDILKNIG